MKSFNHTIATPFGIHARPSVKLSTTAQNFKSNIVMIFETSTVNMKSILNIMGVCAKIGDEITITADGTDENEAILEMKKVVDEVL